VLRLVRDRRWTTWASEAEFFSREPTARVRGFDRPSYPEAGPEPVCWQQVGGTWAVGSALVRCPRCSGAEDRVIDSRTSEDGAAIRRRRECLACGRRFTTYERLEEVPFVVVKRSGQREPFERAKIIEGMKAAAKNRPLPLSALEQIAVEIEEGLRLVGPEVGSQQVGLAVLEALRGRDHVAYLRFASVYKDFTDAGDFQREAGLLTKVTTPKTGATRAPD